MDNILNDDQVVLVIKLKSGELITAITSNIDEDTFYAHAPAIFRNHKLTDFMYCSTSMGFTLKYNDIYFAEPPSDVISILYSEFFINYSSIDNLYNKEATV